ncbi:MAG: acVLRF1 family peptidyl-tRNA hydrolase [Nocardioides sp.]
MPEPTVRELAIRPERVARWIENFSARHGGAELTVRSGALAGAAQDGSYFVARWPFAAGYEGPPDPVRFADALVLPAHWGVLLVRKGGFAVARLRRQTLIDSKVGRRHVQGKTKAGGQSQQRFARRRDNQARDAYAAAADQAVRVFDGPILDGSAPVVAGGDRGAVAAVLADPRRPALRTLRITEPWLAVADPRRSVLLAAIDDATAVRIEVTNSGAPF